MLSFLLPCLDTPPNKKPPPEGEPCINLLNCISGKHEVVKRQMVNNDVDLLDEKNSSARSRSDSEAIPSLICLKFAY